MSLDGVALIPRCVERGAVWPPGDDSRWRLCLGVEEDLEEPPELVWMCGTCAAVEFG